jgi:hypothetical protein
VAADLSRRLIRLFLRNADGLRPIFGGVEVLQNDPHWRDLILFNEYFHGDNGADLVAKVIQQSGEPESSRGRVKAFCLS